MYQKALRACSQLPVKGVQLLQSRICFLRLCPRAELYLCFGLFPFSHVKTSNPSRKRGVLMSLFAIMFISRTNSKQIQSAPSPPPRLPNKWPEKTISPSCFSSIFQAGMGFVPRGLEEHSDGFACRALFSEHRHAAQEPVIDLGWISVLTGVIHRDLETSLKRAHSGCHCYFWLQTQSKAPACK